MRRINIGNILLSLVAVLFSGCGGSLPPSVKHFGPGPSGSPAPSAESLCDSLDGKSFTSFLRLKRGGEYAHVFAEFSGGKVIFSHGFFTEAGSYICTGENTADFISPISSVTTKTLRFYPGLTGVRVADLNTALVDQYYRSSNASSRGTCELVKGKHFAESNSTFDALSTRSYAHYFTFGADAQVQSNIFGGENQSGIYDCEDGDLHIHDAVGSLVATLHVAESNAEGALYSFVQQIPVMETMPNICDAEAGGAKHYLSQRLWAYEGKALHMSATFDAGVATLYTPDKIFSSNYSCDHLQVSVPEGLTGESAVLDFDFGLTQFTHNPSGANYMAKPETPIDDCSDVQNTRFTEYKNSSEPGEKRFFSFDGEQTATFKLGGVSVVKGIFDCSFGQLHIHNGHGEVVANAEVLFDGGVLEVSLLDDSESPSFFLYRSSLSVCDTYDGLSFLRPWVNYTFGSPVHNKVYFENGKMGYSHQGAGPLWNDYLCGNENTVIVNPSSPTEVLRISRDHTGMTAIPRLKGEPVLEYLPVSTAAMSNCNRVSGNRYTAVDPSSGLDVFFYFVDITAASAYAWFVEYDFGGGVINGEFDCSTKDIHIHPLVDAATRWGSGRLFVIVNEDGTQIQVQTPKGLLSLMRVE